MPHILSLFLLTSLFAQDAKEVTKDWKHPWAGATVGTWVKFRVTHYTPVATPGGDTEDEENSSDRTDTVAKVSSSSVHIRSKEGDSRETSQTHYVGLPAELNYKVTSAGEEDIKVGDKTYKCKVYEFRTGPVTKGGKDGGQLLKVWKAADTPVWAVRQQFWLDALKKPTWTEEWTGTETLKVSGQDYSCAVVKKTTAISKIEKIETTWGSPQVPGGVVRRIDQTMMGGKEQKMMGSKSELIGFERK